MKRVFVILFLLTGVLFSCNNATENMDQSTGAKVDKDGKVTCMELVFPITYVMPDGSTISGNDRGEIGSAMRDWHKANPSANSRGSMQYPVNAIFKGNEVTINNDEDMQRYRKECEEGRMPCFAFIYPITYIMPDGTEITLNSEDDVENKTAIRAWYGDNPGNEGRPALLYPLDVKLKDGTTSTLESDKDLHEVRDGCK